MKRLLAACLFLVVAACTKNEAEQTADWNKNVTSMQKYAAKFPAFKSALDKQTAEAQTSFDAAKNVADKDARSEAMGTANRMLTEVLQDFTSYESATNAFNESLRKHSSLPASLEPLVNTAKAAQKSAESNMGGFEPSNIGAAKVKVEDSVTQLKDATDALASSDGYLEAEKQFNLLLNDKTLLDLPASKVNPALEAAKTAQRNAGYALTEAGGTLPKDAKAAVVKATKILADATAPLKALKPAPAPAAAPEKAAAAPAAAPAKK
jgi:hypothetical protein